MKPDDPAPPALPAFGTDRHVYGPRPVGAVLPGLVKPVYRKRSPASMQVMADWESIVGADLARVTAPKKLFSGTLSIVCHGPVAMELQHLSDMLIARINTHLGRTAVTRLRLVQDILPQPPAIQPPRRLALREAERAVESIPPGELRDALERLGRVILTPHDRKG